MCLDEIVRRLSLRAHVGLVMEGPEGQQPVGRGRAELGSRGVELHTRDIMRVVTALGERVLVKGIGDVEMPQVDLA